MPNVTQTKPSTGTTVWKLDSAHSLVEFSVKHMMIARVKGRFSDVEGTIALDESDITKSKIEVEIDAASIDTREPKRDAHLRSPDFLDVEQYPHITFTSRRIERKGENAFNITGDLTIRDVTREVVLDARYEGRGNDPWGGERLGASATTTIDRRDYGLTWNQALETGGVLVGNEVKISLEIEAVKQED